MSRLTLQKIPLEVLKEIRLKWANVDPLVDPRLYWEPCALCEYFKEDGNLTDPDCDRCPLPELYSSIDERPYCTNNFYGSALGSDHGNRADIIRHFLSVIEAAIATIKEVSQ